MLTTGTGVVSTDVEMNARHLDSGSGSSMGSDCSLSPKVYARESVRRSSMAHLVVRPAPRGRGKEQMDSRTLDYDIE